MQFSISDERLEQIEFEVVENNYEKIKYAEEKRNFFWLVGSFFAWIAINSMLLTILRPTTGDNDMAILIASFIVGSTLSLVFGYFVAKRISRRKFLAMAKNYLDNKKDLMLERVLADYKADDNLLFFRSLYEDNLIDSEKRAQIDNFLAQENKTISDYLKLLNKKELAILAEPYKQRLVLEAKARIDEYFMKKDEQSTQNMEFYEKGKDFFYSGLPKNLANFEHYKSKSYKNYKG